MMKKKIVLAIITALTLAGCTTPNDPIATDISLSGEYKTHYEVNETLDTSKLVVTATYENGEVKQIKDYEVTGFKSDKLGECEVKVKYQLCEASFKAYVDTIAIEMPAIIGGVNHKFAYQYDDNYFNEPATIFNKDLALISFALAQHNLDKDTMNSFYKALSFDEIYFPSQYDLTPTEHSISYAFAHKQINDDNIVAISIKGLNYGKEWVDNFTVGDGITTEDHEGFKNSSVTVYNDLKSYLDSHNYQNVKLWISGYSRSAAVANVLSASLSEENEFNIPNSNIYAYTFEAPRGLSENHAKNYANIYNIVNNADFVARLLPDEFALYRAGKDINIYTDKDQVTATINKYFPNSVMDFEVGDNFSDDVELSNFLINAILTGIDSDKPQINSRENYYNNYQETFTYFLGFAFGLSSITRSELISRIRTFGISEIFAMLADANACYELFQDILEADPTPFDKGEFISNLTNLLNLNTVILQVLLLAVKISGEGFSIQPDFYRMLYMHMPETVYALLKDYTPVE